MSADDREKVNHPNHYKAGGIEAIDVIEAFGLDFNLGNALKYLLRAGRKPGVDAAEDLRKCAWYVNRAANKAPIMMVRNVVRVAYPELLGVEPAKKVRGKRSKPNG